MRQHTTHCDSPSVKLCVKYITCMSSIFVYNTHVPMAIDAQNFMGRGCASLKTSLSNNILGQTFIIYTNNSQPTPFPASTQETDAHIPSFSRYVKRLSRNSFFCCSSEYWAIIDWKEKIIVFSQAAVWIPSSAIHFQVDSDYIVHSWETNT